MEFDDDDVPSSALKQVPVEEFLSYRWIGKDEAPLSRRVMRKFLWITKTRFIEENSFDYLSNRIAATRCSNKAA
jgi:hypothetical protein